MTLPDLRDQLAGRFNKAELVNLCFDLGINHEQFPDTTLVEMARELVAYCRRSGRLPQLIARCRVLRPHLTWIEPPLPEEKSSLTAKTKPQAKTRKGDDFRVKLGNVGSQAQFAVGRNIQQSQSTAGPSRELMADIFAAIKSDLVGGRRQTAQKAAEDLQAELNASEPDIGKLQTLKLSLTALGGKVAAATQLLFSHEQVQAVLKHAAEIAVAATLRQLKGS
jgi:hypothetical protein